MFKKQRLFLWCLLAAILVWIVLFGPPASWPQGETITIKAGSSIAEIGNRLVEARIIKWSLVFRVALALGIGESLVVAGDYYFNRPSNVWQVAARLGRGDYGLTPVKVTFPEGTSVREMAAILAGAWPGFDSEAFIAAALPAEGYLFPDTYFFQPASVQDEIIKRLRANFQTKIEPLKNTLAASGRTLEQIIIMASLLEKEAPLSDSRRIIADILWKRLDEGMPLQVDAVFPYIIGKNTFELDQNDLATSSPYNTYRFRGLPAGPITNPGLDAIRAALNPMATDYWYYLSDRDGKMHYAVDFDAHRANRVKYLPR